MKSAQFAQSGCNYQGPSQVVRWFYFYISNTGSAFAINKTFLKFQKIEYYLQTDGKLVHPRATI